VLLVVTKALLGNPVGPWGVVQEVKVRDLSSVFEVDDFFDNVKIRFVGMRITHVRYESALFGNNVFRFECGGHVVWG
jgi:hypothetical protein